MEEQRKDAVDDLALAGALLVFAALMVVVAPSYFDASKGQASAWRFAAVFVALLAFGGATSGLQKLGAAFNEHWGDILVAVALVGLGWGATWLAERVSVVGASGAMRSMACACAFLAIFGASRGFARMLGEDGRKEARRQRRESLGTSGRVVEVSLQLLALATAVVGFLAAISDRSGS